MPVAPEPPYQHRQPTSWGNIIVHALVANLILFVIGLYVYAHPQNAAIAFFALTVYPIIIFLESLFVHGLKEKYGFFFLSFVILLILTLLTTFSSAGIVPHFSWPAIVTQWHFYVYFPAIAPYLSYKLSQLLFRSD